MSDNPVMSVDLSRLDPAALEEQSVWRDPKYGIITRVGVLLSIYFVDGHVPERRRGGGLAFCCGSA